MEDNIKTYVIRNSFWGYELD